MSEQVDRPTTAKSWRIEPGVGLLIDEQVFPWYVQADGPMVEPFEHGLHVLWLPVLVEGDIPKYGRPNGEMVAEDAELIVARAEADWITLSADTADWQRRALDAEAAVEKVRALADEWRRSNRRTWISNSGGELADALEGR